MSEARQALRRALEQLKRVEPRPAAPDALDRLEQYIEAVLQYRRTHRIVGPGSAESIALELVADALGLWPLIRSPLADVGSGAGLPGLVLKLVDPDLQVTLIEPRQKPAAFLSLMSGRLGLAGLRVLDRRAEELQSADLIGGVAARSAAAKGFGPLQRLVQAAQHLVTEDGELLVLSSAPDPDSTPGARIVSHPLLPSRFIHIVSRSSLPPAGSARRLSSPAP